jgi:hypothetical protein
MTIPLSTQISAFSFKTGCCLSAAERTFVTISVFAETLADNDDDRLECEQ